MTGRSGLRAAVRRLLLEAARQAAVTVTILAFVLVHVFGAHVLVSRAVPANDELAIWLPALSAIGLILLLLKALNYRTTFLQELFDNGLRRPGKPR